MVLMGIKKESEINLQVVYTIEHVDVWRLRVSLLHMIDKVLLPRPPSLLSVALEKHIHFDTNLSGRPAEICEIWQG